MSSRRNAAAAALLAVAAALAAPSAASADERSELPVVHSSVAALAHATAHPDTPPAGANDWSCKPSPEHPNPVVLVHATTENMTGA